MAWELQSLEAEWLPRLPSVNLHSSITFTLGCSNPEEAGQTLTCWARHEKPLEKGLAMEKPTHVITLQFSSWMELKPGPSVG